MKPKDLEPNITISEKEVKAINLRLLEIWFSALTGQVRHFTKWSCKSTKCSSELTILYMRSPETVLWVWLVADPPEADCHNDQSGSTGLGVWILALLYGTQQHRLLLGTSHGPTCSLSSCCANRGFQGRLLLLFSTWQLKMNIVVEVLCPIATYRIRREKGKKSCKIDKLHVVNVLNHSWSQSEIPGERMCDLPWDNKSQL